MRIVSLNVAPVSEVLHKQKLVRTAIFKQPTTHRILLDTRGFVGDEQADKRHHGWPSQAAYAFSAEEYGYWRSRLGRLDLPFGLFGENMTCEGLDDAAVCIGDIFRVGEARIQVTFPRLPCSTLALAVGDAGIVKGFLERKRVGPYFAVLTPGLVGTGDELHLEAPDPGRVSILELMYLLHDAKGNAADRQRWDVTADIPALDSRVREKLRGKLAARPSTQADNSASKE